MKAIDVLKVFEGAVVDLAINGLGNGGDKESVAKDILAAQWNDVKDGLPKHGKEYLIWLGLSPAHLIADVVTFIRPHPANEGWFEDKDGNEYFISDVTHWSEINPPGGLE